MGLIHTPRTIASIAKGFVKRRTHPDGIWKTGLGTNTPYLYRARAGLFDVDYLGHLNNAAFLTHAELARWEMTAYNGLLTTMAKNGVNFMVAGTAIRYRREVRPIWRQFQVDTTVAALDAKNIWITHNFRYPTQDGKNINDRVRAQMIVRGVAAKNKVGVLDPREFFRDTCGMPEDLVESLSIMPQDDASETTIMQKMLQEYVALEESFRQVAAVDDDARNGK